MLYVLSRFNGLKAIVWTALAPVAPLITNRLMTWSRHGDFGRNYCGLRSLVTLSVILLTPIMAENHWGVSPISP